MQAKSHREKLHQQGLLRDMVETLIGYREGAKAPMTSEQAVAEQSSTLEEQ
jgi:hypothetical protein